MSSRSTFTLSLGHMYCCFSREPQDLCSQLNVTPAEDSEVEAVCGRVAILRAGQLLAVESIQTLRGRVVRHMQVRFAGEAPATLAGLPGVARAQLAGREATLWVQGALNPLLREIAGHAVDQLSFPEPQLENIFLEIYGREDRDRA